jgi:hypothetical protein
MVTVKLREEDVREFLAGCRNADYRNLNVEEALYIGAIEAESERKNDGRRF